MSGTRLHVVVGLALGTAGALVFAWTVIQLRHDRAQLVDWFAEERAGQLAAAVTKVEDDFQDVGDDLEFAARLVTQGADEEERRRSLSALLGSVVAYRLAVVYDAQCRRVITVVDPRWASGGEEAAVLQAVDLTSATSCRTRADHIETSTPIAAAPWFRAFATAIPDGSGVVALVVDTRPVLDRLKAVSAGAAAELVVLGPHGLPTPATSAALAERAGQPGNSSFAAALDEMRAGRSGTRLLPAAEAIELGFTGAEVVMTYLPIRVDEGDHWSVAALVSTGALADHERSVLGRVLGGGTVALVILGLFGAYVAVSARREAVSAERLRSAEQIAHLRDRAERILDHVPAMVLAVGNGDRVSAVNAAALRACPSFEAGIALTQVFSTAQPEAVTSLAALVDQARSRGRVAKVTGRRLALFSEEGTFSVSAIPIAPPSPEIELLLVIDDVSGQRKLQDQLLHVEKLATVGVLAAGIAHEIGTPLGVIRGRAEYVAAKLGPDHPMRGNLGVIVSQIDRVVRTVRALLDFSGRRRVATARVDLAESAAAVVELVRFESERRKVELLVDVTQPVSPVAADADQVQQVLVNLAMNAMDASAPGGRVWFRAQEEAATDAGPARVRLDVVDEGRGIPEADLHRVFDPFYTTKKRGQGTGLGLAIVSQIVRDHGGEVAVQSTVGRGTTVFVWWPTGEVLHG